MQRITKRGCQAREGDLKVSVVHGQAAGAIRQEECVLTPPTETDSHQLFDRGGSNDPAGAIHGCLGFLFAATGTIVTVSEARHYKRAQHAEALKKVPAAVANGQEVDPNASWSFEELVALARSDDDQPLTLT